MSAQDRVRAGGVRAPDQLGRVGETDSITKALTILRRRWMIVVAVVIACVAVAVVHKKESAKSYAATANVAFQSATLSDAALQVASPGSGEPQREANTEMLVAH